MIESNLNPVASQCTGIHARLQANHLLHARQAIAITVTCSMKPLDDSVYRLVRMLHVGESAGPTDYATKQLSLTMINVAWDSRSGIGLQLSSTTEHPSNNSTCKLESQAEIIEILCLTAIDLRT
jgi:hypothetical protein